MSVSALPVCVVVLLLCTSAANAENEKAQLGRVLYSAFTCSKYASAAGKAEEANRLFKVGIQAGRKFLEAVINKEIPAADLKGLPIGVTWYMQGPSVDFIIGRIYEGATKAAYDHVSRNASHELVRDDATKKLQAENRYVQSNCALIR